TLNMYLGSLYVNSFNAFGRHWQVTVQAEGQYRDRVENLSLFQVRSQSGEMIPLSTLVHLRDVGGPISITRYNLYTAATINGNIFGQIGLSGLVGLACKNAILIVEFAKQLHQEGRSLLEATAEASRLRLRPILMTSFAFIFGVVPLVVASGAGAEMRRSLGIAVFSGMLGVTLFGIFLTPVFFYVLQWLGGRPGRGSTT